MAVAPVQAATEAWRRAQDAFRNGLAINLDVLSAQDDQLNAEVALAAARFDHVIFYLNLMRATDGAPDGNGRAS